MKPRQLTRALCRLTAVAMTTLVCHATWGECDGRFTVNQGTLGGGGQVNGDLTNVGGSLSPGGGVGSFSVLGNYCQLPGAEMVFEIGGLRQRIDHDFLWVNGTAELSGGFRIELINDFTPSAGDEFRLMNLLRVEGEFDTMTVPDLGANANWDFSNLLDAGIARVVPEPGSGSMGWFFFGVLALVKRKRAS